MTAKYWNRLSHEREQWQTGLSFVAGVEEAGCVMLPLSMCV